MKKNKWIFKSKYLIFYFRWNFEISYESCGYFDNRPRINIGLIFFYLTFILPFRNKWEEECDPPKWGIAIHNSTFWIYRGGKGNDNGGNKWWTIDIPFTLKWVRTSMLLKGGLWEHSTQKDKKEFYLDKWNNIVWSEIYPFTYTLKSGETQYRQATVKVKKIEWRRIKWLPVFNKIKTTIDVEFNEEVGEETGSWKGGCTGCSYELLPNEDSIKLYRNMLQEHATIVNDLVGLKFCNFLTTGRTTAAVILSALRAFKISCVEIIQLIQGFCSKTGLNFVNYFDFTGDRFLIYSHPTTYQRPLNMNPSKTIRVFSFRVKHVPIANIKNDI